MNYKRFIKWKYWLVLVFMIALLAGCTAAAESDSHIAPAAVSTESNLTVHFLDVGEGHAALLESDGRYMLVDGGVNKSSSYVVAYLKKQGVESLDYVIATHYDADHLAGIVGVLHSFPIDQVIGPDYQAETKIYQSFTEAMAMLKYNLLSPVPGDQFTLGSSSFTVVGPTYYGHSDVNDDSIAIRIQCGNNRFLIAGDAGRESELEMIESGADLKADVYLVNHHGSETSTTQAFLDQVDPRYAVISSGSEGNNYGHPREEILTRLKDKQIELFRTDRQGEIIIRSDGLSLSYDKQPCNDFTAGNESSDPKDDVGETEAKIARNDDEVFTYVLNIKSKKVHLPTCHTVAKMNEANREFFDGSLEELIESGYEPCSFCLP